MNHTRSLVRGIIAVAVVLSVIGFGTLAIGETSAAEAQSDQRQGSSTTAQAVEPLQQSADTARVAVAQISINDKKLRAGETTVDRLIPWMDKAAKQEADLVVFPEYLLGHFFVSGQLVDQLCEAAKDRQLNVIVGGWEFLPGEKIAHPPKPGTYANTILVVNRQGEIAGKHRKMHSAVGAGSPYCWPPEPNELGEQTMVKGDENAVVDLDFGRIGVLTCYDGYFFESFQMPSLRGAEVLVWVNAREGMVEPHIIQAASFITCTHVVASNQAVGCGSAICSYPGWALDKVAGAPAREAFIVSDLDMAEIRKQRLNNRMLHQRRPQIYRPIVQEWKPWEAYPHIEPFKYEKSEESQTAGVER